MSPSSPQLPLCSSAPAIPCADEHYCTRVCADGLAGARAEVVDNIVSSCKIAKVPVKFDAESGFQADTSSTAPAPSQSATAAGDAANSANGGLSGTQKIGIGVGVPVLVLGMLALVGA